VALQNGTLGARRHCSPKGTVRGVPAPLPVAGTQVVQGLGDAEQRGPTLRVRLDCLRCQPQQPGTPTPLHRVGIISDLQQPPEIGIQQVSVVARKVIHLPDGPTIANL